MRPGPASAALTLACLALTAAPALAAAPTLAPLPGSPYDFGFATAFAGLVEVAPLNGDEREDVVAARSAAGSQLRTLIAPVSLAAPFTVTSIAPVGVTPDSMAVVDADGDGDRDIATFGYQSAQTYANNGSGAFAPLTSTSFPGNTVAVGRFTADALPDAVTVTETGTQVLVTGTVDGRFAGAQSTIGNDAESAPLFQASGDLDGDGDQDVVGVRAGSLRRLINNGSGGFTAQPATAITGTPLALAAADLDEDGKADPIVLTDAATDIVVLRSTGGTTVIDSGLGNGAGPTSLAVADLDGDGHLDLIAANAVTNDARVLMGSGSGTLAASQSLGRPGTTPITDLSTGDLTGDDRADLAIAVGYGQFVHLLANTTPWPPRATTVAASPTSTTSGRVSGLADPRGVAGSVSVEYGTTTAYGSASTAVALSAGGERAVEIDLTGLQPATEYHARLVVTTPDGTTQGADRTFTTTAEGTPVPPPPPPASAGGPIAILNGPGKVIPAGLELPFDASASLGDGLRFAWDVDGDGFATDTGTNPVLMRRFDAAGSHRVRVRVTDTSGRTAEATTDVVVPDPSLTRVKTVGYGAKVDAPVDVQIARPSPQGIDRFQIGKVDLGRSTVPLAPGGPAVDLPGEAVPAGKTGSLRYPAAGGYAVAADAGAADGAAGLRFVIGVTAGSSTKTARRSSKAKASLSFPASFSYTPPPTNKRDRWSPAVAFNDGPGLGQAVTFADASRFSPKGTATNFSTDGASRPHTLVYDWDDGSANSTSVNGSPMTHRWNRTGTFNVTITLYDAALGTPGGFGGQITVPVQVVQGSALCTPFSSGFNVRIEPVNGCFYSTGFGYSATPGTSVRLNGLLVTGGGMYLFANKTKLSAVGLTLQTALGPVPIPSSLASFLKLAEGAVLDIPGATVNGRKIAQGQFSLGGTGSHPRVTGNQTLPAPAYGSIYQFTDLVTGQEFKTATGGGGNGGGSNSVSLGFLDFGNLTITNRSDGALTFGADARFGPYSLNARDSYPGAPDKPASGLWFKNGGFLAAGAVADVPVPVFPGLELGNFGIAVEVAPIFKVSGGASLRTTGIVAGRRVAQVDGCILAFKAAPSQAGKPVPGCQPNVFFNPMIPAGGAYGVRVAGDAFIFGQKVARGSLSLLSPGGVLVEGRYETDVIPYGLLFIRVGIGVGYNPVKTQLYGQLKAEACTDLGRVLQGCYGGADFVLSTTGIGACINTKAVSPGVWYRWGQPLSFETIWDQSYFWGCEVQKLEKNLRPRAVPGGLRASLRQDAPTLGGTSSLQVRVTESAPQTILSVTGAGGAPIVRVKDGAGKVVAEDTVPSGVQGGRLVFGHNDRGSQTGVFLKGAKPGTYTIETLPGSVPLVAAELQQSIKMLPVRGVVSRRGPNRFALKYIAPRAKGQTLVLQEKQGKTELGYLPAIKGSKGTLLFTPSGGPRGKRTILARLEQDGRLIRTYPIATYTAPPLPKVAPVRGLKLTRKGTSILVSWKRPAGVASYRLQIATTDGGRTTTTLKGAATRLSVRTLGPGRGATVTIVSQAGDGRESSPMKGRLKAAARPKAKPVKV